MSRRYQTYFGQVWILVKCEFRSSVNYGQVTDGKTDRKWRIWAHRTRYTGGLNKSRKKPNFSMLSLCLVDFNKDLTFPSLTPYLTSMISPSSDRVSSILLIILSSKSSPSASARGGGFAKSLITEGGGAQKSRTWQVWFRPVQTGSPVSYW